MTPDYLTVVEACYAPARDDRAWVDGLLDSAGSSLSLGSGFGLSLFKEQPEGVKVMVSRGRGRGLETGVKVARPVMERMRGDAYRRFFYPRKPVVYASPIIAKFNPVLGAAWKTILRFSRVEDLLGMTGYPAPGWIFTMFFGVDSDTKIDAHFRAGLQRIRIHIESGLRLRLLGVNQAAAVLSPAGKILHLANDEAEAHSEQLSRQAKAIDHARTRAQRQDAGLRVWTALVDGRWSLVEHTDSDGQRGYLAFENTPSAQAYRALTPRESIVVDQSIQGLASKCIAYSTGLSPSRISHLLTSAASKLGFRDRVELVRVASTLRGHGKLGVLATPLTEAERDVWALVYKGLSNAEIAGERGTSVRTVVNQVASLFRKVGVNGRSELVAKGAPEPAGEV